MKPCCGHADGEKAARLELAELLAAAKRATDALSGYGVGSTNYEVFIALSEAISKAESRRGIDKEDK